MSAPHLIVLHGALGSAAQMAPIASALATLGTVDTLEFPGHGETPLGEDQFSLAGFAGVLERRVRGSRPLAFGHSMGGYVALALEAHAPGTFSGIVTLGTKFDWTPDGAAREVARLDPRVIAKKVPKFAALLAARHERSGGWEQHLQHTAGLITTAGAAPLLTPASLARIACPAHLAVGALDDTVTVDETARAARAVPGGSTQVLEGVGHPIERVPVDLIVAMVASMQAKWAASDFRRR